MNLTKRSKVADLGARNGASVRQVVNHVKDEKGRMRQVIERLPWGKYMKVVKPSGSVERIPTHNGCANDATDDPYKLDRETRKPRRGSIPFGQCLQTQPRDVLEGLYPPKWFGAGERIVPEELLDRPSCRAPADGWVNPRTNRAEINADHPCQCILDLIEYRKARNVERDKMQAEGFRNRQAEAAEGMVEAVQGLAQVVKGMQEQQSKPPRGKANE